MSDSPWVTMGLSAMGWAWAGLFFRCPARPIRSPETVSNANAEREKKQQLGQLLYPLVQQLQLEFAGKITGMLLEMSNDDIWRSITGSPSLQSKFRSPQPTDSSSNGLYVISGRRGSSCSSSAYG